MVNILPLLQGVIPPAGGDILRASARHILHQNLMLYRFPCIQTSVNPQLYLAGFGHILGALEDHYLKYDESLSVPAALMESCEFRGQHANEAVPDFTARRVVPPCGHDRQVFPPCLPLLVVCNTPTEVRSIVGVHPVFVDLLLDKA